MRIDAHHHIWRYSQEAYPWIEPDSTIARDFSYADLAGEIGRNAIDAVISVQARQEDAETDALLALADQNPAIVGVVGWIDLRAGNIEDRIARRAAPRLKGYRHVVQDEPDPNFLLRKDFVRGVKAVVAAGLTYDILVNHKQLGSISHFLDQVGAGRFVLDHAAKPAIAMLEWQPWADGLAAVAARPDVFCKISGLVTEADHLDWRLGDLDRYLDHIFASFGHERILWGSDWPVCLLAARYDQVIDLIADYVARHCPEAEAAVFGHNALDAYAIESAIA